MWIRKKHIGQLLLLCFSVFLAHNLVPHHHHSGQIASPECGTCPAEHGDHHEERGQETHCHAFNDLAFNKVKSNQWTADVSHVLVQDMDAASIPDPVFQASETALDVPPKALLPSPEGSASIAPRAPPGNSGILSVA